MPGFKSKKAPCFLPPPHPGRSHTDARGGRGQQNLFFRRRMRGHVFPVTLLEVGVWPRSPPTTRLSPERYLQPGSLTNTSSNEASKAALSRLPCTGPVSLAGAGKPGRKRACGV